MELWGWRMLGTIFLDLIPDLLGNLFPILKAWPHSDLGVRTSLLTRSSNDPHVHWSWRHTAQGQPPILLLRKLGKLELPRVTQLFISVVPVLGYIMRSLGSLEKILMPGSFPRIFWLNFSGLQPGHQNLKNFPRWLMCSQAERCVRENPGFLMPQLWLSSPCAYTFGNGALPACCSP